MTSQKQSQFTAVTSVSDTDYIPIFGSGTNEKILKTDLFTQIKDETQIFIYPTTELLQAADLVADPDFPIYVRNEETEYRLYKITTLAAVVDDIELDNGTTATYQHEYRDLGFIIGPDPGVDNALVLFDGVTGDLVKTGVVPTAAGNAFLTVPNAAAITFPRKNADNTVTMRSAAEYKTDLSLNNVDNTSDANKPVSVSQQAALDLKVTGPASATDSVVALFNGITGKLIKAGTSMADYLDAFLVTLYNIFPRKVNTWADIATTSVIGAGQLFNLSQHTSSGLGGGPLMAFSGSVADDGIIQKNALGGFYLKRIQYQGIVPEMAGAIGNGIANDTTSVQLALNYCTLNNRPLKPMGSYLLLSELTIPQNTAPGNAYGVTIEGGGSTWNNVSVFYAQHNGAAILNLKGANGCSISGMKFKSDPTTYPKCGIVLGRDANVDSCGWHNIRRNWIDGNFSVAGAYSIGSEENVWSDNFIQITGGGAKYGFYSCISDALSVDSLPTGSNIANSINRMHIWNWQAISDSACIYLECGEAMGSWTFNDCYCIPKSGSYYQINMGTEWADAPLGGFSFINCGGEIYSPISPWTDTPGQVFRISSGLNLTLKGLNILGGRGQLINSGGTRKILNVDSNVTLLKPNIVVAPLEDSSISFTIVRNKVNDGVFDVSDSSKWTALTFLNTWVNSFGAPYAPAAFQVDNTGTLRLRGTVTNAGAGVSNIAQLPPGFEPLYNMFFPTRDGIANAELLLLPSGILQLNAGTGGDVDLSPVSFKLTGA